MVIKPVRYWHENRQAEGTEHDPETDPYVQGHLIYDEQQGKSRSF